MNTAKRPYIVGLTGGIGSGKTTVSNMFADLGAEVIDADEISRGMLKPGSEVLDQIEQYFGMGLFENHILDRARLREIIFADPVAKAWLEQLLHPKIREEIIERIDRTKKNWVLVSAPLLLENASYDFLDCIVIVDAPETLQVTRAMGRDGVSEKQINDIVATQMKREDRLMHADEIIYNDADMGHLQRQVSALHQQFEDTARERTKAG